MNKFNFSANCFPIITDLLPRRASFDLSIPEKSYNLRPCTPRDLIKLKECIVYRIDITSNLEIQMEYNVSAIPTIIIFESGKEKERFNPNVMFQLEADKKTIQYTIDTLILNKFQ